MGINFELIVSFLLVLIVVLVVALVAIQRFSLNATKDIAHEGIDKQSHAFPPETLSLIGLLIGAGTELSKRTATPVDDEAFKMLAKLFGYVVEISDGKAVVAKAEPTPQSPAPAPTPPAENG